MLHSPRVEVFLDRQQLNKGQAPFYEAQYHEKILKSKEKVPMRMVYGSDEYHIKKFVSKEARGQFLTLLQDAHNARIWTQEIKTEEAQKME